MVEYEKRTKLIINIHYRKLQATYWTQSLLKTVGIQRGHKQ